MPTGHPSPMNAAASTPTGDTGRAGRRVMSLPPREENPPVRTFAELKDEQTVVAEEMLALVAADPHMVEQMNLLLDRMHLVNVGFVRAARQSLNEKWERRLAARVESAHAEGRRAALEDWVHGLKPDEAIDRASGHLTRLVLGWSGDSGKAARAALEAMANLHGAWVEWARERGVSPDDPAPSDGRAAEAPAGEPSAAAAPATKDTLND